MDYFNSTRVPPGEMTNVTHSKEFFGIKHLLTVIDIVTISIELPVLCLAVFVLSHQVKAGYVIPVYVINLLISDFIQIISRIFYELSGNLMYTSPPTEVYALFLFMFGIFASIGFMVCIALERYLLVVHPLWYRCHHTIKHSILLSLAVWPSVVLFSIGVAFSLALDENITFALFASFIIIPLLLLLFFLGAICRALSHSISVPHKEKKRILGTLALILLIYIALFCPTILWMLGITLSFQYSGIFLILSFTFMFLSPLADPLLYILTKRRKTHRKNRDTPTVLSENITSV